MSTTKPNQVVEFMVHIQYLGYYHYHVDFVHVFLGKLLVDDVRATYCRIPRPRSWPWSSLVPSQLAIRRQLPSPAAPSVCSSIGNGKHPNPAKMTDSRSRLPPHTTHPRDRLMCRLCFRAAFPTVWSSDIQQIRVVASISIPPGIMTSDCNASLPNSYK